MSPAKGQKSPFCIRGHDKRVVGTAGNGWCRECRKQSYARRGLKPGQASGRINFRSEWCPAGHHKPIVGVTSNYACLECRRIRTAQTDWRAYRRELASRRAGLPEGVVLDRATDLRGLRAIRLRAGLTHREMAMAIGLHPRHYQTLEVGRKGATRETVNAVVRALRGHGARPMGRGRYRALVSAMLEAERRGDVSVGSVAALIPDTPIRVGSLLRWAGELGLVERFAAGVWLVTDEGRAMAEGRAA